MRSIYILILAFALLIPFKGSSQVVCIEAAGYPQGTKIIKICKGTGINLTGKRCVGVGGIFQWTNLSDPNQEFFDENPKYAVDSGQWVVTDISVFPNPPTDTIKIEFYPFDIADIDKFQCSGQPMTLNILETSAYTNITWYNENITEPQGFGSTFTFIIKDVTPIRAEAKHSTGCIATDRVFVPLFTPPLIGFEDDSSICKGDSIVLVSPPSSKNKWYFQGVEVATSESYIAKATGTYKLIATNDINCTSIDSIKVKVNPKPEVTAGNDTIICFDRTVTLKTLFNTAGTQPYVFAWSPTASLLKPADQNPIAKPTAKTTYRLLVKDLNGCNDTTSVTVSLYPELKATPAFMDTTVCQYQKVMLKQHTTGGTPFFGSIPYIYKWRPNSTIKDSTSAAPEFAPSKSEKIILYVRDSKGCTDTASLMVKISDLRVQITSGTTDVCLKDSIRLNSIASGGSPDYDIIWASDFAAISNNKVLSPWVTPTLSGIIKTTVLVRDQIGCTYKDSVNINALPIPTVNISTIPKNLCLGDSILIIPNVISGATKLKYNWSLTSSLKFNLDSSKATFKPTVVSEEIVSLYVSAAGTCNSKKDSVKIKTFAPPLIELGSVDTQTCSQTSVLLKSPSSYNSGLTYTWSNEVTKETVSTDSVFYAAFEGKFKFTVTNKLAGCSRSDIKEVIFQKPPESAIISSLDSFCSNRNTTLTAIPINRLNTYSWNSNTHDIKFSAPNSSSTDLSLPNGYSGKSIISLTISNLCGSASGQKEVIIHPSPIASIERLTGEEAIDSTRSYFSGQPMTDTLYWAANNSPSTKGTSTNSFESFNLFSVSLYAINSYGCSDTAVLILDVLPPPPLQTDVFVPNVFAPQSTDEDNNALKVFGKNVISEDFNFQILNRWGEVLYETNDFIQAHTIGWNGTINNSGTPQMQGSYTYFVRGKFADGSVFEKSGSALLLR